MTVGVERVRRAAAWSPSRLALNHLNKKGYLYCCLNTENLALRPGRPSAQHRHLYCHY